MYDKNKLDPYTKIKDGSVFSWGVSFFGGDSSAVADRLKSDVAHIYSNDRVLSLKSNKL